MNFKKFFSVNKMFILSFLILLFVILTALVVSEFLSWSFVIFCIITTLVILLLPIILLTVFVKNNITDFGIKNKKIANILFTIIFVTLSAVYLAGGYFTYNKFFDFNIQNALLSYDPAIEYLQEHKTKYGKYPEKLDFEKVFENKNKDRFKYEKYESKENGKEYVIRVTEYEWEYLHSYYYCSNKKYKECYPHKDYPSEYTALGKWIEYENHD